MDIYYVTDGKKQPPVPTVEIISMLERGDLSEQTLGWHRGCSAWLPLKELPALQSYFVRNDSAQNKELDRRFVDVTETAVPIPGASMEKIPPVEVSFLEEKTVSTPPPSARFFARALDLTIYFSLYVAILVRVCDHFDPSYFYITCWLPAALFDSICLKILGTTPGKSLLGISVVGDGGENPNFLRLLGRELYAIILGMGLVVSIVTPFCLLFAWFNARSGRPSYWDRKMKTRIIWEKSFIYPVRLCIVIVLMMVIINIGMQQLEPWSADILKYQEEHLAILSQMLEK